MMSPLQQCASYVIVDALCFALTIIIASNVTRDSGSERQVRFFFMLLTSNLVFVISDSLWAILAIATGGNFDFGILSVVNCICLTAVAFAAYFWFCFSLAYFESRITNNRTTIFLAAIPAFLVVVIYVIGYFTGEIIILQPDGSITYGVLHSAITYVMLLYLAAATIVALHQYRQATTRSRKRMALVFILFMLPPVMAGVFDMFIPNTPIAAAGMMIAISFVMMAIQEDRISSDALTGLNNRRRAESYLEDKLLHASEEEPLCLLIIDMDRFKEINDTYGHLEGDHALQLMGDTLRSVCSETNAFAGRWGGDEFVVITTVKSSEDARNLAGLVQQTLSQIAIDSQVEYDLQCSVGYALCPPANSSISLISRADESLYQNKQVHYQ